jgi:hypothetical protein
MIKTLAIPARLLKSRLTEEEQAELETFGHQEMTPAEAADFLAGQQENTASVEAAEQICSARKALVTSDMVAIRCFKSGISFPPEWKTYVNACRAIVKGAAEPLPEQPPFPDSI